MNRLAHALSLAFLLALCPSPARAQVRIHIDLGLPVAPRLVVVQPGIQVVEGFQEEVFFHRGWYWCRRQDGWYRSRSPRARFGWIEPRYVPGGLIRVPVGHYRNWHRPEVRPHEGGQRMSPQREHRQEARPPAGPRQGGREAGHDRGKPDNRRNEGDHGRH